MASKAQKGSLIPRTSDSLRLNGDYATSTPAVRARAGPSKLRPIASTSKAVSAQAHANASEDSDTAEQGTSRVPLRQGQQHLSHRKPSLRANQASSASKTPLLNSKQKPVDVKGKGREIDPAPAQRSPGRRKATVQNYALHNSAMSEEDDDAWLDSKPARSSRVKPQTKPVQTPKNIRPAGKSRTSTAGPSTSRTLNRARTASVQPDQLYSAMKPMPLKTVYLSSPPRPNRSSETESSSGSEDEVLLVEHPRTSVRKRKAAAGEYEWDERSRSCVPKRERSRSRSMTAFLFRNKSQRLEGNSDDDPASDRSHLQEKIFQDSEPDLLKHLLTNRLNARVNLRAAPTSAKLEGEELLPHLPAPESINATAEALDMEAIRWEPPGGPDPLDDWPMDDQPAFDSTETGVPDDDDDNDGSLPAPVAQAPFQPNELLESDFDARRVYAPSSDDGFEDSIIRLSTIVPVSPGAEDESMARSAVMPSEVDDRDPFSEPTVDAVPEQNHTAPLLITVAATSTPERVRLAREDSKQALAALSAGAQTEHTARAELINERYLRQPAQTAAKDEEILEQALRTLRSSSELSSLPPSSPPPLPTSKETSVTAIPEIAPPTPMSDGTPRRYSLRNAGTPLVTISVNSPLRSASKHTKSPLLSPTKASHLVSSKTADPRHDTSNILVKDNQRSVHQSQRSPSVTATKEAQMIADARRSASRSPSRALGTPSRSNSPSLARRSLSPATAATPSVGQAFLLPVLTPVRLRSPSPSTRSRSPGNLGSANAPYSPVMGILREASKENITVAKGSQPTLPKEAAVLVDKVPLSPEVVESRSVDAVTLATTSLQPDGGHAKGTMMSWQISPPLSGSEAVNSAQDAQPKPSVSALQFSTSAFLARVRALRAPAKQPRSTVPGPEVANVPPQEITSPEPNPEDLEDTPFKEVNKANDIAIALEKTPAEMSATDDMITPGTVHPESTSDDISDTNLEDMLKDASTDSEAEAAEVERSLSRSRSFSKSPAPNRRLLPTEDPQLSPNVTLRKQRSASRSTASTRSTRSRHITPQRASSTSRRLSFSDLGAMDSSPISVAASISRRSFEALDTSSEEEDELAGSPSNRDVASHSAASLHLLGQARSDDDSESVDSKEDSQVESSASIQLSSSPEQSASVHDHTNSPSRRVELPTSASTPSHRLQDMVLDTSDASAKAGTSPLNCVEDDVIPSTIHLGRSEDLFLQSERECSENNHVITGAPPWSSADGQEIKDESPQTSLTTSPHRSPSLSEQNSRDDVSAALDSARPRTALLVPPLTGAARPVGPTRKLGSKVSHSTPGRKGARLEPPAPEGSPLAAAGPPVETASCQRRSQSVVSQAGSSTSHHSTVVQVSSSDPNAAARAAAILKVHHQYIQDGQWPSGVQPLGRAKSGASEEGEKALDDMLRQAEREASAHLQDYSHDSQVSQVSDMLEQGDRTKLGLERRERSISASRHFVDVPLRRKWTRLDWRALEQCFIDELRRKRNSRHQVEPSEVVSLYLESEQLDADHCVGEWDRDKLEIRVQALLARKQQRAVLKPARARSTSVASSVCSRAPTDFLLDVDEASRMREPDNSASDSMRLDMPGALFPPRRVRYAHSAEPVSRPGGQQDYAPYRRVTQYQSLQGKASRVRVPLRLGRERSLESVAEEAQSVASEPPPFSTVMSNRSGGLYPSLDDLRLEMRPKRLLSVRGRSVARAVNMFERIEEEQSVELLKEQAWLKRKASESSLSEQGSAIKKTRL